MLTKESDGVRVLSGFDLDATMTDVGERVRPPGDPPDKGVSWASKVAGTGSGGMPVPEEILDDAFVASRLSVDFPHGEDGEPVITIDSEVLKAMNGMWKNCMVVKVLGRNVAIAAVSRKLRELWQPRGGMYVLDLPRQFFMVRFEIEEEYLAALTGGPWRAFGSYLMVQAWSPEFDPLRDDITTTPVWVRLMNIPVNFYHRSILMGIAKGLGNPVRVDSTTLKFERARFARVCVEINLAKPLKGTVLINDDRYFVAYEGLMNVCVGCGLYGHLIHACPTATVNRGAEAEKVMEQRMITGVQPGEGSPGQDDGFTQVRGRKSSVPSQATAPTTEMGAVVTQDRNLREIWVNKERPRITVSNKFGSLDTSQKIRDSGKQIVRCEENKENEISGANRTFTAKAKERLILGGMDKNKVGPNVASKDKRSGLKKPNDVNWVKVKQSLNKPARGLIFGPTKGEASRSESGKRLRLDSAYSGKTSEELKVGWLQKSIPEKEDQIQNDGEDGMVLESNVGEDSAQRNAKSGPSEKETESAQA